MATHRPLGTMMTPTARYARMCEEILDEYKHGEIDAAQASGLWEEQMALLSQHYRDGFLIRLRNLEAFRVRRGQLLLDPVPGSSEDGQA